MNILDVVLFLVISAAVSTGTMALVRQTLQMQTQIMKVNTAIQCADDAAADELAGSVIEHDGTCAVVITPDVANGWVEIDANAGGAKEVLQLPEDAALN